MNATSGFFTTPVASAGQPWNSCGGRDVVEGDEPPPPAGGVSSGPRRRQAVNRLLVRTPPTSRTATAVGRVQRRAASGSRGAGDIVPNPRGGVRTASLSCPKTPPF